MSYDEPPGDRAGVACAAIRRSSTREIAKGQAATSPRMFFTSGTTGTPKGVVLTHHNLIDRRDGPAPRWKGSATDDVVLAYLPPAWIGQNIFSYAQPLVTGYCICCPESAETVMTDMREIGPTYYFAPPRVLESAAHAGVDPHGGRGRAEARAVPLLHGRRAPRRRARSWTASRSALVDRLLYSLGDLLVYGPLRNVLGMSRVRVAYTAGEAIGPDLFMFYRSIGINLKQLYGSTETSVFVCIQPDGQVKRRHRRPGGEGRRAQRSPRARAPDPLARAVPGVLQEPRGDRRGEGRATAGSTPATPATSTPDGHLKIIDRAQGRRQARRRHAVRAEVPREQAQVLPVHQGGGRASARARQGVRVHQHRPGGGRQLGREAQHRPTRATPTSPRETRSTSWCASASSR